LVCVHIYICVYMYVYIHIYIIYMHMGIHTYTFIQIYIHIYICKHMYIYICMYMYIYVHVYRRLERWIAVNVCNHTHETYAVETWRSGPSGFFFDTLFFCNGQFEFKFQIELPDSQVCTAKAPCQSRVERIKNAIVSFLHTVLFEPNPTRFLLSQAIPCTLFSFPESDSVYFLRTSMVDDTAKWIAESKLP